MKLASLLISLSLIGCTMAISPAHAKPQHCFLKVNGTVYINRPCNVDTGHDGSFTMGAGEIKADRYFVYMNRNDDGTMEGFWNGVEAESHANGPLGTLSQSGRCWTNTHAKVCATCSE